ncbi:unnamed protein product [Arctogadus glacialis]
MSDTGQVIRELHLLNALDVRYGQAAGGLVCWERMVQTAGEDLDLPEDLEKMVEEEEKEEENNKSFLGEDSRLGRGH